MTGRTCLGVMAGLLLLAGAGARVGVAAGPVPERIASGLQFPEGVVAVGDALYFVDFGTSAVLRLAGDAVSTVWHEKGCGANGLLAVPEGLWVACYAGASFELISFDGRTLRTIVRDQAGHGFESPNDFAADGQGGAWLTASGAGAATGKVYHMASSFEVKPVADGLAYANGLALSPDRKLLYVSESKAHRISVFATTAEHGLGPRRTFVDLDAVLPHDKRRRIVPDSMRVDGAGNIYVALYEGGGIAVFRPDGTLMARVELPLAHHTSLAISADGRWIVATALDDVPGGGYRGELYRVPNPAHAGP